jgi:hypothetical protein
MIGFLITAFLLDSFIAGARGGREARSRRHNDSNPGQDE